jgi:Leucine-rich repeat (LRR) protein
MGNSAFSKYRKEPIVELTSKDITTVPKDIKHLKRCVELKLNKNSISLLPPEVGELAGLVKLDISENTLTSLPDEIEKLQNLLELNCSSNRLFMGAPLNSAIGRLKTLKFLDLSFNQLSDEFYFI